MAVTEPPHEKLQSWNLKLKLLKCFSKSAVAQKVTSFRSTVQKRNMNIHIDFIWKNEIKTKRTLFSNN